MEFLEGDGNDWEWFMMVCEVWSGSLDERMG